MSVTVFARLRPGGSPPAHGAAGKGVIVAMIEAGGVLDALRARRSFSTRSQLRAERFYRLSPRPAPLGGLTAAQQHLLLAAHETNRVHYLPYCARCRQVVTFDHSGLLTWVHERESEADHSVEVAEHDDSHQDHPKGLSYVVWVGAEVIAWILNDGTVTHVGGNGSHSRMRGIVRRALDE